MVSRKSQREIEIMRKAGSLVAQSLQLVESLIAPGVTTAYLNDEVEKFILANDATPEFKGFDGFPAAICASINEEIVHGVPGTRRLEDGDIISIDIGVRYQGYVGDAAKTFPVGNISPVAKNLLEVCEKSLYLGIESATIGNKLSHISGSIQTYVESKGYSVVRDYTGHGIGRKMHEDPQIPNYVGDDWLDLDLVLKQGHCLAIEPMVNIGTYRTKTKKRHGWDVVLTKDNKLSAHFEHTIAVTSDGPMILTLP
ncbi:MAG: type I methionyl aminopeptidase [Planctomycetes bacterium]|nr:type I methionyl aminopeptidase [Planctomycetota bacterium]HON46051.1 type I methionyl aminopeptidase [Planctomycetota bacterium]HPY75095.1 type I methionyl aminopeptidase [Planctomycetota bacterium]HQB00663.1 type I methionyl aminopeptidase [Planctomycetota bacterium]HRU51581.1 type I methionyl aminopeptidase [Planctomycetota bacterium]